MNKSYVWLIITSISLVLLMGCAPQRPYPGRPEVGDPLNWSSRIERFEYEFIAETTDKDGEVFACRGTVTDLVRNKKLTIPPMLLRAGAAGEKYMDWTDLVVGMNVFIDENGGRAYYRLTVERGSEIIGTHQASTILERR